MPATPTFEATWALSCSASARLATGPSAHAVERALVGADLLDESAEPGSACTVAQRVGVFDPAESTELHRKPDAAGGRGRRRGWLGNNGSGWLGGRRCGLGRSGDRRGRLGRRRGRLGRLGGSGSLRTGAGWAAAATGADAGVAAAAWAPVPGWRHRR